MGSRSLSARAGADVAPEAAALMPVERLVDPELRLQHALDIAYRYLARRDRTTCEVRRRLEHERVEPDTIEQAVASLREAGYLDDARYAQCFAEDRRALDGWGADRIERRLVTLGIAAELIARALCDRDAADERAAAVALLRRRPATVQTPRERERALAFLVRKGYGIELGYEAVRAYERESG